MSEFSAVFQLQFYIPCKAVIQSQSLYSRNIQLLLEGNKNGL